MPITAQCLEALRPDLDRQVMPALFAVALNTYSLCCPRYAMRDLALGPWLRQQVVVLIIHRPYWQSDTFLICRISESADLTPLRMKNQGILALLCSIQYLGSGLMSQRHVVMMSLLASFS